MHADTGVPAGTTASYQDLSQWGLPHSVVQAYAAKGVQKLFPWQAAALMCCTRTVHRQQVSSVRDGNLLYTAPTSGGKSLVADVLMIRSLTATATPLPAGKGRTRKAFKKALIVLPYISVVNEKTLHLTAILRGSGLVVKGYGSEDTTPVLSPWGEHIALCSIEKANVGVSRLIEEGRVHELCCVVVDELHMLTEAGRGVALELLLTKLLLSDTTRSVQIVAMSATISGLDMLATWLRAHLFVTNYRPVPLQEHAVFGRNVYIKSSSSEVEAGGPALQKHRLLPSNESEVVLELVQEAWVSGQSTIIFCTSKRQTQAIARKVGAMLEAMAEHKGTAKADEEAQGKRKQLLDDLMLQMEDFINPDLPDLVAKGVAFHHSQLSREEKALIERGFREGTLRVLTSTTTLAAGVNLPAHRVIIDNITTRFLDEDGKPQHRVLPRSTYLQMVGRAGRTGHTDHGESYVIGNGPEHGTAFRDDWGEVSALMHAPLPSACSGLLGRNSPQSTLPKQVKQQVTSSNAVAVGQCSGNEKASNASVVASGGLQQKVLGNMNGMGSLWQAAQLQQADSSTLLAVCDASKPVLGMHVSKPMGLIGNGRASAPAALCKYAPQGPARGPSAQEYLPQGPARGSFLHRDVAPVRHWAESMAGNASQGPKHHRGPLAGEPVPCAQRGHATQGGTQAGTTWGPWGHDTAQLHKQPCRMQPSNAVTQPANEQKHLQECSATGLPALHLDRRTADSAGVRPVTLNRRAAASAVVCPVTAQRGLHNAAQQRSWGSRAAAVVTELDWLLLDGIANGSTGTMEQLVALLNSTLLSCHESGQVVVQAAKDAVNRMREQQLVEVQGGNVLRVTRMGRAVYASSLPLQHGILLYEALQQAHQGVVLEDSWLHLVYLVMLEPRCKDIAKEGKQTWLDRLQRRKQDAARGQATADWLAISTVLKEEVVDWERTLALYSCKGIRQERAAVHGKLAYAMALTEVIEERVAGPPGVVAERWKSILKDMTVSLLQEGQMEISKWAGMGAKLAGAAGWAALEISLTTLAAQAAAGAKKDVQPLLKIPDLKAHHARALFSAGLHTPALVAAATSDAVAEALGQLQCYRQKPDVKGKTSRAQHKLVAVGVTGDAARNVVVRRIATSVVESACKYLAAQVPMSATATSKESGAARMSEANAKAEVHATGARKRSHEVAFPEHHLQDLQEGSQMKGGSQEGAPEAPPVAANSVFPQSAVVRVARTAERALQLLDGLSSDVCWGMCVDCNEASGSVQGLALCARPSTVLYLSSQCWSTAQISPGTAPAESTACAVREAAAITEVTAKLRTLLSASERSVVVEAVQPNLLALATVGVDVETVAFKDLHSAAQLAGLRQRPMLSASRACSPEESLLQQLQCYTQQLLPTSGRSLCCSTPLRQAARTAVQAALLLRQLAGPLEHLLRDEGLNCVWETECAAQRAWAMANYNGMGLVDGTALRNSCRALQQHMNVVKSTLAEETGLTVIDDDEVLSMLAAEGHFLPKGAAPGNLNAMQHAAGWALRHAMQSNGECQHGRSGIVQLLQRYCALRCNQLQLERATACTERLPHTSEDAALLLDLPRPPVADLLAAELHQQQRTVCSASLTEELTATTAGCVAPDVQLPRVAGTRVAVPVGPNVTVEGVVVDVDAMALTAGSTQLESSHGGAQTISGATPGNCDAGQEEWLQVQIPVPLFGQRTCWGPPVRLVSVNPHSLRRLLHTPLPPPHSAPPHQLHTHSNRLANNDGPAFSMLATHTEAVYCVSGLRGLLRAAPGTQLVCARWLAADALILAQLAGDVALYQFLQHSAWDASDGLPDEVQEARLCTAALVHGWGSTALAAQLSRHTQRGYVSVDVARRQLTSFCARWPSLQQLLGRVQRQAQQQCCVLSLIGRTLALPTPPANAKDLARHARAALSLICQQSLFDIHKAAVLALQHRLTSADLSNMDRKLVLTSADISTTAHTPMLTSADLSNKDHPGRQLQVQGKLVLASTHEIAAQVPVEEAAAAVEVLQEVLQHTVPAQLHLLPGLRCCIAVCYGNTLSPVDATWMVFPG